VRHNYPVKVIMDARVKPAHDSECVELAKRDHARPLNRECRTAARRPSDGYARA